MNEDVSAQLKETFPGTIKHLDKKNLSVKAGYFQ